LEHRTSVKYLLFSIFLVSSICLTTTSHAATIWDKRKKAVEGLVQPAQVQKETQVKKAGKTIPEEVNLSDPADITIPDQYGTIIERHKGTNGRLIVHIQDAHANYEGQMNEADILKSLIKDYGLSLILLEGKVSDLNFNYIRARAPLEERVNEADKLLKEGEISGVNYLNITTNYHMSIQGIEDKKLYDENTAALWEIDKFKVPAYKYVNRLLAAADILKPHIYNKDLLDLDSKKKDYNNEKIDLLEYYGYLYKKSKEKNFPLYTFPDFQNLIKASQLEKKIDMAKVREGKASDEEMKDYNDYLDITKDLNINALFKQEAMLESTLEDISVTNPDQRKLLRISKALVIMRNFLRIKVVPEEYKYFLDHKGDFGPRFWSDFLKEKSQGLNLSLDIPGNDSIISDNLPKIERFYNLASQRDRVFIKRVNVHIGNEDVELAALVAGGFHTPTLTKLLADNGYSYIVVSPKVTTETDDNLYRSALKREWLPEIK